MKKSVIGVFLFVLLLQPAMGVKAQGQDYPTKPIQLLVGFAAGGLADTTARALAKQLEAALGKPVLVVNKPGAGGALGVMAVKAAKPDGYTIGICPTVVYTYNPLVQKVQYSADDFKFFGAAGKTQEAFVSAPDSPWKDFKGLVEYAKKHPGLSYASMQPVGDKIASYIAKKEGVQWRGIPTKGGEEVMTAILGKHVDFGYSGGIHASFVRAGKMITLGGTGDKRLLGSPEVPTLQEQGYDVQIITYMLLSAPKTTPDFIIKKLEEASKRAAKDAAFVELLEKKLQVSAAYLDSGQTEEHLKSQIKMMKKLVQQ